MYDVRIETLEDRRHCSAGAAAEVFLGFPRTTVARVGHPVPPIVIWAQDASAHISRSFNEPVMVALSDGSTRTAQFHRGIAMVRGLQFTKAVGLELVASAAGATSGTGELDINPGPAASFQVTQSLYYQGATPVQEFVELAAFDRYGNGTDFVTSNVRPKLTATPGVTAVVQPTNVFGERFRNVIYMNGRAVAVQCGAITDVYINFGSASAAQAEATSVQLVFSNRKIKPVWTPPFQPPM